MASSSAEEGDPFVPFTKAERIQQLNDIDKSVINLLQSAGLALKALTASKDSGSSTDKREAFEQTSNTYLKTLQSVDVRLRRQIYGLEEANIIPAEKTKAKEKEPAVVVPGTDFAVLVQGQGQGQDKVEVSVADGGMGKLDIGWLNSRSGRVGRDMEAELWEKSKIFVEEIEGRNTNGETQNGKENELEEEDYEMEG